jgi:hypothetical protein
MNRKPVYVGTKKRALSFLPSTRTGAEIRKAMVPPVNQAYLSVTLAGLEPATSPVPGEQGLTGAPYPKNLASLPPPTS